MTARTITVDSAYSGFRLDKFLSLHITELSRNRIQSLLSENNILLNNIVTTNSSYKVKENDFIQVIIPEPTDPIPKPREIFFEILYEDDDLIVLNKPAGLVVHPAPGHKDDTLVNALLAHCGESLSGIGGVKRPGIVHRLDKDTSGLMVVAKNDFTHFRLADQFSSRTLTRTYHALIWGVPSLTHACIKTFIARCPRNRQKMAVSMKGKEAVTHYHLIKTFGNHSDLKVNLSLVSCSLETGRTHQIRVHMTHIGHPLLGDPVYGNLPKNAKKVWPSDVTSFSRQALHAKKIQFVHPRSEKLFTFESEYPKDFLSILEFLENKKITLDF